MTRRIPATSRCVRRLRRDTFLQCCEADSLADIEARNGATKGAGVAIADPGSGTLQGNSF
jgi:hypothetical protein